MPASSKPVVEVFFTPEFKRNLRTLAKKYHSIRSDVQPFIEQIQQGEFVGNTEQSDISSAKIKQILSEFGK